MLTKPWTILVVDDDEDVIEITRMVLEDVRFDGRGLRILAARSAREGRQIFADEGDIAVALVDVVMEDEHAGLELVKYVRDVLGRRDVRLVLRTGNPGVAPPHEIVRHLEIDDYKEKTELTAYRLETCVLTSLRSYRDLKARERMERGLEHLLAASTALQSSPTMMEFLHTALMELTAVVQLELDNEWVQGGLVLHQANDRLRVLFGLNGYQSLEGREVGASDLPPGLFGELGRSTSAENIRQLESGWLFSIRANHTEAYHFWVGAPFLLPAEALAVLRILLGKLANAVENTLLQREVHDAQATVLTRLCGAVESRSKETGSHIRRIALYARHMAQLLALDDKDVEILAAAAPMHDIGKIAIPDAILNKPGRLSADEWTVMKSHAEEGFNLLDHPSFKMLRAAAEIARTHHEKWDGSGYPRGLAGEDIPLFGRIVALVDVFDALLSRRSYKDGWPLEHVLDEMRALSGTHFDPALLDLLLANIDSFHDIFHRHPD